MNESVGSSSNRTKVNLIGDILCTVNNNFVNTANKEFFNTVNKEYFNEIKSPPQLNEHEVDTNITDIGFIVNCSTKNTDRVISDTDNTSDQEVLSTSYMGNFIQEFKTLMTKSKIFKIKTEKNFIQTISVYPNIPWKIDFQIEVWKKGTVLILGDSIVSGVRENKMSFRKDIKVHFFY